MNDPFAWAMEMTKEFHRLGEIRAEAISKRRSKAQNNPITKARKSAAMKKFYADKKEREKREEEEAEFIRDYRHESCYCHMGNAPCGFCTDTNYCETCDVQTWDDDCPKCGKDITK